MKNLVSTLLVVLSALAPMALDAEPLPLVYEAVTLATTDGKPRIAVFPRSVPLQMAQGRTADTPSVQRIFETMKARFPAAYGTTTLSISGGREPVATINLDPSRKETWGLVTAEIFYTLKSFGFENIVAPLYLQDPLNPSLIDAVVMVPVQPWFNAAGEDFPSTIAVSLDGSRMISTSLFRQLLTTGNPDVARIVQAALSAPLEAQRLAAVRALAAQKPVSADLVARISSLLTDPSPAIRGAILELAEARKIQVALEDLRKVADADQDPALRLAAAKLLSAAGVRDYDHILEVRNLRSGNPTDIAQSLRRLKTSGKSDIAPAVAETLESPDETVRNLAVEVLLSMKAATVVAAALQNPKVQPAQKTVLASGLLSMCPGDDSAIAWMAGQPAMAGRALAALCGTPAQPPAYCRRSSGVLPVIPLFLKRPETEIRLKAIECLSTRNEQEVLDLLIPMTTTAGTEQAATAAASAVLSRQPQAVLLGIISGRGVPAARATRQFRLLALNGLASQAQSTALEPSALAILKGLMKDPDIEIRRAATGVMARSRDAAVAALVLDGINDQDEGIRTAAVIAAGRIPGPASDAAIRKSLEDLSVQVRAAGLEILASRPLEGTRPKLQMLAQNQRPEIRRPAVAAFLKTLGPGDDAVRTQFVSTLLYDNSEEIRIIAVRAMEEMTDTQSARAVGSLVIDRSVPVRVEVARVLGQMRNDVSLDYLKKMARDQDFQVRKTVIEAVGRFPVASSTPAFREMLGTESDGTLKALIEQKLAR
ncbi:MAG TPA: HEAT repeat domain-containing protein [Myxococcota bacterium]|nr:HEAT repeat domain-containing protein [Myxococcota bacterium]